jgi:hypothetical protein
LPVGQHAWGHNSCLVDGHVHCSWGSILDRKISEGCTIPIREYRTIRGLVLTCPYFGAAWPKQCFKHLALAPTRSTQGTF